MSRPEGLRRITQGMVFTAAEEEAGEVELAELAPRDDPPPEETRGEPWGWTKGPPYPRGYRETGDYDAS